MKRGDFKGALYYAPDVEQYVLLQPPFQPQEYGFLRDARHRLRYYGDTMAAMRLVREGLVAFVSDGARKALAPHIAAIERSSRAAPDPALRADIPCPPGKAYLPYQIAGIQASLALLQGASLHNRKGVLLADEMGLGKTIQAIGVANAIDAKRILVICPAGLRLTWEREIQAWSTIGGKIRHVRSSHDLPLRHKWSILSYDLARTHRRALMYEAFDLVICDEAHYLKSPAAGRTKAVCGCIGPGKHDGIVSVAARAVFLSGTPAPNRPIETWSILKNYMLAYLPPNLHTFARFSRYYGRWTKTDFGWKYVGGKRVDDLNTRLRASMMIRRLKVDVLADLPPKTHKLVVFPATSGPIREVLKEEKAFDAAEIARIGKPKPTLGLSEQWATARWKMGMAKVPLAIDYIADLLEEVPKVVVFCWHVDVAKALQAAFPHAGLITGKVGMEDRQKAVDLFQNGDCRVIVGNIQAMGVGWTLTAASNVVMVEHSPVPGENVQAADRCHRVGQTWPVMVHDLVVEGSLDGAVLQAAARKSADIEQALK